MRTVREGKNAFTCMPDNSNSPGNDPMCLDKNAMAWAMARGAKKDPPQGKVEIMYMLQGGSDASNTDTVCQEAGKRSCMPFKIGFQSPPNDGADFLLGFSETHQHRGSAVARLVNIDRKLNILSGRAHAGEFFACLRAIQLRAATKGLVKNL